MLIEVSSISSGPVFSMAGSLILTDGMMVMVVVAMSVRIMIVLANLLSHVQKKQWLVG